MSREDERLAADARRGANWKRWGTYLSSRQWGTVREDYSPTGECWTYFPHDHSRSRVYRWGEDGLLGYCDRQARLCFSIGLWNGVDPILKERLFGLTGPEGNHGEDVKELYYFLDATPTTSYARALYKYPQGVYPYEALVTKNREAGRLAPEWELLDTGLFDEGRYFDVFVEYAKASAEDTLIVITVANRGPEPAELDVLPTLWFRNTWSWGRSGEGYTTRPSLESIGDHALLAHHPQLDAMRFECDPGAWGCELAFTENETNFERLFGTNGAHAHAKDAFHDWVIRGDLAAVNPARRGTKAAARYRLRLGPGESTRLRLRLRRESDAGRPAFGDSFERTVERRLAEADQFYSARIPLELDTEERRVARQAYAGLLWSRQFYCYVVREWMEGDPTQPPPPPSRAWGRNNQFSHLYNRDVISMPDDWEYPWYAAWDLAFHMVPFARVDPEFAKGQLVLLLREWYMHPNGQIPAYEFAFGDVNPPVHAWAALEVYRRTSAAGQGDRAFLAKVFQKLLLNFTWWVNRTDAEGNNLFAGGFLGLDNVGVFDRSQPLPTGGTLDQADGTAWMAFYCSSMLEIALELAGESPEYEDVASKFFEHFVAIADAMNRLGGTGLWDEADGFYYDQLRTGGESIPLRTRSLVGVVPLFAVSVLSDELLERLPGFRKRMLWFLEHRSDLGRHISYATAAGGRGGKRLLALPTRDRLVRVLRYVLDETEMLSSWGVRSLSRTHLERPFVFRAGDAEYRVDYVPGESTTGMFGGNSNWRGPVWFPLNFLLIEALHRYHSFYGADLRVECPTGSGRLATLAEVADELALRMTRLFVPGPEGGRPCHGDDPRYRGDPHFRDLVLFYEHFHGDDGRGLGASHQTGWTALVATCLELVAARRARET